MSDNLLDRRFPDSLSRAALPLALHAGSGLTRDRRLEKEGDVDGRRTVARVWSAGPQGVSIRRRLQVSRPEFANTAVPWFP